MSNIVTIDGIQYDAATIPPSVINVINTLSKAQQMKAEKEADLLIFNTAVNALSQQLRGALAVIPQYVPTPPVEENQEDVHKD